VTEPQSASTTRVALSNLGCAEAQTLSINGASAEALVEQFGTPLYAYSAKVLTQRAKLVQAALGPRFELLWSVKANPSVAVTSCLRNAGAGAEIASTGELKVALAAGHRACDLRFAGPGKSEEELRTALDCGLGTFHVESLDELQSLQEIAQDAQQSPAIALRVNLPQELKGARMRMGGSSSRFGIDADQIPEAVRFIQANNTLRLRGLHVYGGTQCFDADAFVSHARALCSQAAAWETDLDVQFKELDLGGGFGVAVFEGDPTFDLPAAAAGLAELLKEYDRPQRRWFVELGRYLAAPAGVFLTKVLRTKSSGGQHHAVLDGGMHNAAAAAGIGSIVRRAPLVVAAQALQAAHEHEVTLGGPLCTPADQFADQLPMPPLAKGDVVAILNTGAYGLSYSPTGFLSHPSPSEVMIYENGARIIRARGSASDALRGQEY
jgi:diaminopimelate decarboxylase